MIGPRTSLIAATATLLGTSAGAQQRTDFNGQWAVVDDARPSVASRGDGGFRTGDMGSGWGSPFTFAQDARGVTITFNPYSAYDLQPLEHLAYPTDGSEARNREELADATTVFTSRAAWQGDALATTDRVPVPPEVAGPGVMAEVRRTITLVARDTLRVETTRVGVAGAPTVTTRTTYARSR